MMIQSDRFNTYLLAALFLAALAGCASPKTEAGKESDPKEDASLRLYLEVNPDGTDSNEAVLVGRAAPFLVNIEKLPFLTEHKIEHASLVEEKETYAIAVSFDQVGRWLLDQYTTSNRGKRIAVAGVFGVDQRARWLGAPRITRSITNGVFTFTPDSTRAEADRLVAGLNNYADKVRKGRK